jgi:MFS family permease
MVTAFTVAYVSNGYIYYALTYLEKWPAFKCTKVSEKECDIDYYREHIDEPNLIRIDNESVYTLDNWVGRLDLFSKSTFQIGLIGSVYLLGWALGCLFVPRMGDIYGRRLPYLISMAISLLVYLVLILSTNINLTTVMFLLLGLTTPAKSNVCYIYLLEFIPKKWQTAVGTALLFGDGSTMIFLSLYFRFISKDWLWFQVFALSLTAAAFLVTLFAPESPKYLYSYKRYKEARKALQVVARFNRVDTTRKYWFDTEYQEMKR